MKSSAVSPWVVRGAYLFGVSFTLTAFLDFGSTVFPPRPTDLAWRYGFLGLAAGYLQMITLGVLIVGLVGHLERRAAVVKAVGMVLMLLGLLLVIGMGVFALDVMSMRAIRPAEEASGVFIGAMLQEVKYGVAALVCLSVGHGALKTAAHYRKHGKPGIVSTPG